jgi:protein phosphatase
MGTTCVCAWIIDDLLYVTYVGNSRIYLLRKNNLYSLTNDHTWVQEAVDAGALTPEQARIHPHANVIRRYLGSPEPPLVDARIRTDHSAKYKREHQGLKLLAGDRLLLCTDGLNDMVEDAQILDGLQHPDLKNAVNELISAANSNGGKDNITVILLEKPKKKGLAGLFEHLKHIHPQAAIAYAGLIIMGLAVLIALVMFIIEVLF